MVVRRKVNSSTAIIVWDSVRRINHQRQLANHSRLVRALQKELPDLSASEAECAIDDCIEDGVLIPLAKGTGPQSFCTPAQDTLPKSDNHDWYCIECHLPGDVEFCASCHRVFHKQCQNKNTDSVFPQSFNTQKRKSSGSTKVPVNQNQSTSNSDGKNDTKNLMNGEGPSNKVDLDTSETNNDVKEITDDDICSVCKLIAEDIFAIDTEQLNYLSGFIFARIKNWLPLNICDGVTSTPAEPWAVESDKGIKSRYFWYQNIDLKSMELKSRSRSYSCLNEIHADILTIRHNVAIFHGLESTEVEAADYMLVDACHDIEEIKQCVNCYHNSNEKTNKYWFCLPCDIPHELVWAKQKGFDYWPAKVIKRTNNQYDVRFFGAKYLRAVIDEKSVKPIHTSITSLKIKRSPTFNKAYEELQLHQLWLRTPKDELDKVIELKTLTKRNSSQRTAKTPLKRKGTKRKAPAINNKSISAKEPPAKKAKSNSSTPTRLQPEQHCSTRSTRANPNSRPPSALSLNQSVRNASTISDAEDEAIINLTNESQDDVISSTQDLQPVVVVTNTETNPVETPTGSPENPPQLSDNKNIEAAEELRRRMEACQDRDKLTDMACDAIQEQVDKFTEKLRTLQTSQTSLISDIKKKQWCYNCEQEAIYHCCWNTSYCSTECQQTHWHGDHKRNCRRKRT